MDYDPLDDLHLGKPVGDELDAYIETLERRIVSLELELEASKHNHRKDVAYLQRTIDEQINGLDG